MGNSASSGRGHHDETVDFGYLTPQGIYTGPRDWNQTIVTQLIVERKLAPFYRPLDDYDESWDDEQILAARREPPDPEGASVESSNGRPESINSSASRISHNKRPSNLKEPSRHPEAAIYRGAAECPICFLYYPPNINHSRCCYQAICTECFVQIKRSEPTTTHLVSEPAACPYCVQDNFGVVYTPPPWRAGLGSDGATPPSWTDLPTKGPGQSSTDASGSPTTKRQRKSFGYDSPDVVTVDQVHPDWEQKLAAIRAAVARRANRRIIMRQVGDRLIPVGVTSGRVHALSPEEAQTEGVEVGGERSMGRRARRRQQNQELNQFLGSMGLGGQDLEELMVMEALRLSLIEHEEQQRRQREEEAKKQRSAGGGNAVDSNASNTDASSSAPTGAPTSGAGASSNTTVSLPPIAQDSSFSTDFLSASSLSGSTGGAASGGASSVSSHNSPGRQSGHSVSVFDAALRSAASTARAIASPNVSSPDSVPQAVSGESDAPPSLPAPSAPALTSEASHASSDDVVEEEDEGLPGGEETGPERIGLPITQRMASYASSLAPSNYDPLPSSPDSSPSDRPLLEIPSTKVRSDEAGSSEEAAAAS